VPPKAPDKMPEGSLVHKGEQPPSKFSRWVSLQAKKNPKEVQAIQRKKKSKRCTSNS
jgi:hypothetical protein